MQLHFVGARFFSERGCWAQSQECDVHNAKGQEAPASAEFNFVCVGGVVTVVVPPSGRRFRLFVFCRRLSLCCLLRLFRSVLASSERGESCTTPFGA